MKSSFVQDTALFSVGLLCLVGSACDDRKSTTTRNAGLPEPSPNASILPAPLASGMELAGPGQTSSDDSEHRDGGRLPSDAGSDAAPPEPHSLREDQALSSDSPHESNGLSLSARLRWVDPTPTARVPEQNADGMQRARDATAFDVVIDLAGGRMRWAFAARSFTLPAGSELHGRDDVYGHALLWPDRTIYTVLAPGTLRSVLAQQRADMVPLVHARSSTLAPGLLFALSTERVELSTPIGRLELEQARGPSGAPANAIWASGASLCQLLVELLGALPNSSACRPDLVPVRAQYTWPNGEHFAFEVSHIVRRNDMNPSALAMPPLSAEFRQSELPPAPPLALLSDNELSELRVRAAARSERPDLAAPKAGLLLLNRGESLRYVSVDGVPAARLPPGAEPVLLGLRAGKYQVAFRDFFGSEEPTSKMLEVPARLAIGEESEKVR